MASLCDCGDVLGHEDRPDCHTREPEREALPCIIEARGCMGPTTVNMVTTRDGAICFPCFGRLMAERVAPHMSLTATEDEDDG